MKEEKYGMSDVAFIRFRRPKKKHWQEKLRERHQKEFNRLQHRV